MRALPTDVLNMISKEGVTPFIYYGRLKHPKSSPALNSNINQTLPVESLQKDDTVTSSSLLYDVMRTQEKKVLFLGPHLSRISKSYRMLWKWHWGSEGCDHQGTEELVESMNSYFCDPRVAEYRSLSKLEECNIKFVSWSESGDSVLPESSTAPFVLFFIRSFYPPQEWYSQGVLTGLLYDACRHDPHAKVIQASLRERAVAAQGALGAYEMLLVNPETLEYSIPEGSRSNFLLLTQDNQVLCSPLSDILEGITLLSAIEAVKTAGLGEVHHRKLSIKDIISARSMVLLGTSCGVLPVRKIMLYCDEASKEAWEKAMKYDELDPTRDVKDFECTQGELSILKEVQSESISKLMGAFNLLALESYTTSSA